MAIPKKLNVKTIKALLAHAEQGYPKEVCGVVVITPENKQLYVPCVNLSTSPDEEFVMCPESYMHAEEQGEVVGICHSHPDWTSAPSKFDNVMMSNIREMEITLDPKSKPVPWHIVSWPEGDYRQVIPQVHESLLGREFVHEVWDCWTLCERWYERNYGIAFPPIDRDGIWWEKKDGESKYETLPPKVGFYQVDGPPQYGDMIVMQVGRTYHPNHAAVFLGDITEFEGKPLEAKNIMLHHLYGRKSELAVYGSSWEQRTMLIYRHKGVTQ